MVANLVSGHADSSTARSGCCEPAAPRPRIAACAAIACALTMTLLAGCYQRSVLPQSEGHIATPAAIPTLADIPPPARVSSFVPAPKPAVKAPTYSVVVNEVPVKELLLALARDTKQNIDIHPGLSGLVSLNAVDETLPAILERIAQQISLRYRVESNTVIITPDTPYMKTYRVNYVNMSRDSTSTIGVSGQVAGATGGSTGGSGATASSTAISTKVNNDFWDALRSNIIAILASTGYQNMTTQQRAERREEARAIREERLQQVEATARAGASAPALFRSAFTGSPASTPTPSSGANDVIVNHVSGTVSVLANEQQHQQVQRHLDSILSAVQRQVLIEATIAEVTLSDQYQAGIDWQRLAGSGGITFTQLFRGAADFSTGSLTVGYANPTSSVGNISGAVQLLNAFGNARVLSSPKLMVLNNQTALLKVVDNIVYFLITATTLTSTTGPASTTFNTSPQTVAVGVVMSVTPQINENGQITLTVRPTISRVIRFKNDPNPSLPAGISSPVPEIQTREMESVLRLVSGQTAILGGLMQDNTTRNRNAVPGIGDLPQVGELFGFRGDLVSKSELVIFLRPTVISSPSLESDELKLFQRLLPQQTEAPTMTVPGEKVEATQ